MLGESKDKRLAAEGGALVVSEKDSELRIQLQFAGTVRYEVRSQWATFLFESMNRAAPTGYGSPGINAIIQCDRAASVRLAEACPNIKRNAMGSHPIENVAACMKV